MQDLKVTLIQTSLHWENKAANLTLFDRILANLSGSTDLIILPEMFTTGFTMNAAELAETMNGPTVQWIKRKGRETGIDLIGSVIISENERYFNRLLWARPDGQCLIYDKRHLFRMAGEEKVYSPGHKRLIVELNEWKICPFICYDLRFPVWNRRQDNEYDVAIFIANWPEKRAAHWRSLLKARAIENLSYVVGVNRIGLDGNGLGHRGDSMVINPKGDILFHACQIECIQTISLSYKRLQEYRQSFPSWMDADKFEIL